MECTKPLKSESHKQFCMNKCFFVTVIMFVLIMSLTFIFSQGSGDNKYYSNINQIVYSKPDTRDAYMMQTDALLKGQAALDIVPSDELLALQDPYDPAQRNNVDYIWDFAFYKGQYYSYFGIVPVILFLLPFRFITGMYLSSYFFSFFLEVGAVVSLSFLYKTFFERFFSKSSNILFTFGLIFVLFGSNILFLSSRSWFYEIAYASGLLFTFLSLTMLLKIRPDSDKCFLFVFLSAVFFALSVGCRPNYCIYFIIHIPVLICLFIQSKSKLRIKMVLFYAAPIIVIGVCIGIFNLIRFDSFFQFGAIYQLTVSDISKNSFFDFDKIYEGIMRYFLQPFEFKAEFPFIFLSKYEFTPAAFNMYSHPVIGLFRFPITWNIIFFPSFIYLSYLQRKTDSNKPIVSLISCMIVCMLAMIISVTAMAGIMERYTVDFGWIAAAVSVFTFFAFINKFKEISFKNNKTKLIINYAANIWFILSSVCSSYICFAVGIMGEYSRIRLSLPFLFQ